MRRIVLALTAVGLACANPPDQPGTVRPQSAADVVPASPTQPRQPLPLDPLTAEERDLASRIALADGRVRELIGGRRHRVTAVELLVGKAQADTTVDPVPQRTAEVSIYVYDTDVGLRVTVDLARRAVSDLQQLADARMPFDSTEIAEARRLALASPELRRETESVRAQAGFGLEEMQVEWLGVRSTDRADPCYRRRCVQLFFRRGDIYLADLFIIVNLSSQTVQVTRRGR